MDRQRQWQQAWERFTKGPAAVKTPIDQEILELVVGLEVWGFQTLISSLGRDDQVSVSFPRVEIAAGDQVCLEGQLFELVSDFYRQHRCSCPEAHLILTAGSAGRAALVSAGAPVVGGWPRGQQVAKLAFCQDEFMAFGNYLKRRFFSEKP